jgi:hypothetical protein
MWLDAVVNSADLQKVVDKLTPATIPLGSRGHLFFDAPAEVSLVADRGMRIRCHAKLLWPVLGIDVSVTVSSMTVMIVPSIESRDGERVLMFTPEVEALDLALLPDIGDAEVRGFINRELQAKRIELPWKYKQTLDHQFVLPDWFRSGATFDIRSNGAAVKVTNNSIGLAIALSASIGASDEREEALPPPGEHRTVRNGANGHSSPRLGASKPVAEQGAALAADRRRARLLGLGIAVAGGFSVGCLVGLRSANR